jgi:hypothetical protein
MIIRPEPTTRTAIVTGASQGIGAGLVTRFLEMGYNVVGNSRAINDSTNLTPSPRLALVDSGVLSALWSAITNPSGANGRLLPSWPSGCRRGRGWYGRDGCPYVESGCDRQVGVRISVAEHGTFSIESLDSGFSSAPT